MASERNPGFHERFKELAALANSGSLSAGEWSELESHLQACERCRQTYKEYHLLASVGLPILAAAYSHPQERENWDDRQARERLLLRVDEAEPLPELGLENSSHDLAPAYLPAVAANPWLRAGLAACLGIAAVFGAYIVGRRGHNSEQQISLSSQRQMQQLASEKHSGEEQIESQLAKISAIQEQNSKQEQEVGRLRTALRALEGRSHELEAAKGTSEEALRSISEQRDSLKSQLQQAEQANQSLKAELVSLRSERDRVSLRAASLESRVSDLTAAGRDQERKLDDDEQFLASDRDIRELMGARKLYIADVFDVDSGSRPRKPFGRIFYTQSKSLIFYAFDLDRQAGVKNASIFQVWGQKEAEINERPHATNLGILYMDSESNRRWVLRVDDSKQLANIDAVFVTVEPHVGNPKPTGKPFLYALLRKEANHP
jgi:hypothetical protein